MIRISLSFSVCVAFSLCVLVLGQLHGADEDIAANQSSASVSAIMPYDEKQAIAAEKLMQFVGNHTGEKIGMIIGRGTKQGAKPAASEVVFLRDIPSWVYVDPSEDINNGGRSAQYQDPTKENAIVGWWPLPCCVQGAFSAVVIDFGTLCHFGENYEERSKIVGARNRKICALVGQETMGPHFQDALRLYPNQSKAIMDEYAPALRAYEAKAAAVRKKGIQKAYESVTSGGLLVVPCDGWSHEEKEKEKVDLARILDVDASVIVYRAWIDPSVEGRVDEWGYTYNTSNSPVLPDTLTEEQKRSGQYRMGVSAHEWPWFEIGKPA